MIRWIRLNYVLPRITALAVIVLAVEFFSGPLVRWFAISAGEETIRAKIDIDNATASLLRGDTRLMGIHVANPSAPGENLFEADELVLDFEMDRLLRKQFVAQQGVLSGLRFATPRDNSGALPATTAWKLPETSLLTNESLQSTKDWFENLSSQLADNVLTQLESVRLAEELVAKWPGRYEDLEDEIQELKSQAGDLQAQLKRSQANPLRNADFIQELPDRFKALDQAFSELHARIEDLPTEAAEDRQKIYAARRHDEELLRERLHVDTIDSAALTAYFLHDRLAEPATDLVRWVLWVRRLLDDSEYQPKRSRGTDILFAGNQKQPAFLIRSLKLQGATRVGGQPIELAGTLENIASHPQLVGEPIRLELTTTGSLPMHVLATIDRTNYVPRDEVSVDCRGLLLPEMKLGSDKNVQITLQPSVGQLTMNLFADGDKLVGDIQVVQKSVNLTPEVNGELAQWHLDTALQRSLGKVSSLSTSVTFSGTLDEPQWEVSSNLGPAVAEAVQAALNLALRSQADQLLSQSVQHVDRQLAELNSTIENRTALMLRELSAPRDELQKLAAGFLEGRGLSLEQLGRRLPENSLFR